MNKPVVGRNRCYARQTNARMNMYKTSKGVSKKDLQGKYFEDEN